MQAFPVACALGRKELANWITDFNLSKHMHLPSLEYHIHIGEELGLGHTFFCYLGGSCACRLNVFPRFVLVG